MQKLLNKNKQIQHLTPKIYLNAGKCSFKVGDSSPVWSAKTFVFSCTTGQIFLPPHEILVLLMAGSVRGQLDSLC